MLKILLTGGHAATTGIAVVEELKKRKDLGKVEVFWIGSKTAIEGSKVPTIESKVLPQIGVNFIPITAGKLQTKFTIHTIPSIIKIPVGFIQAFWHLLKIKPKVVLSFGGYSSFPVVFWSWIFAIPVVLHEQTTVIGRASKASSFFARKIALARSESQKYFPSGKTVVTGNPLMKNIIAVRRKKVLSKNPRLLVIGGSRGSNFINELIMESLEDIIPLFSITHITGQSDFEKVKAFRDNLTDEIKRKYEVIESMSPLEVGSYYLESDVIISRSGANSVSEIIYVGRPTILIPLPRTFMSEQFKNAEYAEKFAPVSVFSEKESTRKTILKELERIKTNYQKLVSKETMSDNLDVNASKEVVDLLQQFI